eukprot:3132885-Prymnesium_polylepis.1
MPEAQCHRGSPRALKVRDNFQGWGNRIGWWLTASALAQSLDSPALWTGWHGAPKWQGGRNYDYSEVRRVVQFPSVMRFIEDSGQGAVGAVKAAGLPRHIWDKQFEGLNADEV